jgi:type IV pilus assembly protein PilB
MSQVLFGELLGRLVSLSRHDVNEILEEQSMTHQRFGEIALSRGLCEPEHLWAAWCDQLVTEVQRVDLDRLGVDARAAALVPGEVARRLSIIPVRYMSDRLVIAIADDADPARAAIELGMLSDKVLRFVIAEAAQVRRALATYHPMSTAAA